MVRLNFIVEGQTEETFVNRVLTRHLSDLSVYPSVRRVETGRKGRSIFRGGITNYAKVKRDIVGWLRQDDNSDARFTTMFDFYALPDDFPSYETAMRADDPYRQVALLENAVKTDVGDPRFIPYIQLHEFEALLLSDPQRLEIEYYEDSHGVSQLIDVAAQFQSPEHIDLGRQTAPSKRIISAIPSYRKLSSGPIIAAEIGLPTLRTRCKHFGQWLATLETLNKSDMYA